MHHSSSLRDPEPVSFWRTRYALGFLVLGAIAAYFLLSEHRAHFIGALPLLLLLSCPLMHVFMHHGHGEHGDGHDHHHESDSTSTASATPQPPKTGEQP
ncbi:MULTISPECIES: DUF2933 domain-containing protein [Polaromonas]|uniref:DUF2933 domain-containing protein n=1 Tax=Polaromonas aquatica TaxID=332657 RepID=A0ABW1TX06_9BURK